MIDGLRIAALIPARGGSKRLPGKNIRLLGGKPLIAWSIDFALANPAIDEIVVSTDDAAIADAARQSGVAVSWLRPANLSSDTASSVDVALHALDQLERAGRLPDILVLLQPTAPFREQGLLARALQLTVTNDLAPVIALGHAKTHPSWCFRMMEDGSVQPYGEGFAEGARSQDLPPAYEITGALYVIGADRFRREKSFAGQGLMGVVSSSRHYDCDVDDAFDWLVAEAVAAAMAKG